VPDFLRWLDLDDNAVMAVTALCQYFFKVLGAGVLSLAICACVCCFCTLWTVDVEEA
jgi:hypothetical protein